MPHVTIKTPTLSGTPWLECGKAPSITPRREELVRLSACSRRLRSAGFDLIPLRRR